MLSIVFRTISDRVLLGSQLPRGFGIAYRCPEARNMAIAVMPLNWLIGWSRNLFFACMSGPRSRLTDSWERMVDAAYATAYREAYKHINKEYQRGWDASTAHWSQKLDELIK